MNPTYSCWSKHTMNKDLKQAAHWAAFFVVGASATTAASHIGAWLAQGTTSQANSLALLAGLLVGLVAIIGWLCSLAED